MFHMTDPQYRKLLAGLQVRLRIPENNRRQRVLNDRQPLYGSSIWRLFFLLKS